MSVFLLVAVLMAPPVIQVDVQQRTFHGYAECLDWAERWYVDAPQGFRAFCLPTGRRVT